MVASKVFQEFFYVNRINVSITFTVTATGVIIGTGIIKLESAKVR
jgi:hypothetical protein